MFGLAAIHKVSAWNKPDLLAMILTWPGVNINVPAGGIHERYKGFHAIQFCIVDNDSVDALRVLVKDKRLCIDNELKESIISYATTKDLRDVIEAVKLL